MNSNAETRAATLQVALDRASIQRSESDALISQQQILLQEANHRLLNNLQMVSSLISLQSKSAANAQVAAHLAIASARVNALARIHQGLHCMDGETSFAFKPYLEGLCSDISAMLSNVEQPAAVVIDAIELKLATRSALPLGFIVNELITNAAKYGTGQISVCLKADTEQTYSLSVSNNGPALPRDFHPAHTKGIGMRLIRSFLKQIGGELTFGRASGNQGARFTVHFPVSSE